MERQRNPARPGPQGTRPKETANVTVLARYGSSATGQVNIEELQNIDPARIKAQYDTMAGSAKTAGATIKPSDGNSDERYGTENEYTFDTASMESGTYHILVEAYHSEYKRWFGYQFQFKVSR